VVSDKVPSDATIVVAAGPKKPLPAEALKALDDYLKAKGKLLVMLDVVVDENGKMVATGLEELVQKFNVKVENDRILRILERLPVDPERVFVTAPPRSLNPVAAAFGGLIRYSFLLDRVRTVRPEGSPAASTYENDILLITDPEDYVWPETNLTGNPRSLLTSFVKDRKKQQEKLGSGLPVAVAVSERAKSPDGAPKPRGPHETEVKPVLAVFGNAKMASNVYMEKGRRNSVYDLFSSTLSWLRERPESIGVAPKKYNNFKLKEGTDFNLLLILPALLMFIGIIGLGTGVWITRRR
jgi:hypothetical protein